MMQNSKTIGLMLIGFSIILLVILTMIKINVDKQNTLLCQKFQEQGLDVTQSPGHKSGPSWTLLLAFGIAFLMLGTGLYLTLFLKTAVKRDFKSVDLGKFTEEEKKIYYIIKSKNGSAYQSDLIKETGFSKVKVTRILDKMETAEIIERKRRGMTNIVVLK